ncbi:MAG: DUF58 domain-containing protein [Thiolinea sp.]
MPDALQPNFDRWLKRRLPKVKQATLNQRRIFIVPGKLSIGMLALIVLLFILAINFQNSLVYVVCFWLMALLVINILYTYRNLSGLTITAIAAEPCFAGDNAILEVEVSRPAKLKKYAIDIGWPEHDMAEVNLDTHQNTRIRLSHPTRERGHFAIPRLYIETRYPTRLAVAWSYLTPDLNSIVYPEPKSQPVEQHTHSASQQHEGGADIPHGSSDFGGIRDYQPGDTPRHIHWGKYAQTGELYTKSFVDYASHELWLDWDKLPVSGIESRLSHLCSRILECHKAQLEYGLIIPGCRITPDKGEAHKHRCLTTLALYGKQT